MSPTPSLAAATLECLSLKSRSACTSAASLENARTSLETARILSSMSAGR